MPRKKKEEEIIEDDYEDEENQIDDEYDYEKDSKVIDDFDDSPADSLGLANQISKESETIKNFKELPREVKYSFLDGEEKRDVKHFARAYRTHQYIEKIIDLRVMEDEKLRQARKKVNSISNKEDLKQYLRDCGRDYLLNDIDDLKEVEILRLVNHVGNLKHNYLLDTVEHKKESIKDLYDTYKQNHETPEYIDDMGNIGKVVETSIASMGYKGNASQHSIMTIQAVKNEDIQKVAEQKNSFSLMDTIKRKLG